MLLVAHPSRSLARGFLVDTCAISLALIPGHGRWWVCGAWQVIAHFKGGQADLIVCDGAPDGRLFSHPLALHPIPSHPIQSHSSLLHRSSSFCVAVCGTSAGVDVPRPHLHSDRTSVKEGYTVMSAAERAVEWAARLGLRMAWHPCIFLPSCTHVCAHCIHPLPCVPLTLFHLPLACVVGPSMLVFQ